MPRPVKIFAAIFIVAFFVPTTLHAGEAILPMKVTLLKCGDTKADIPNACRADDRCCVFMDQVPLEYMPVRMTTIEEDTIEWTGPEERVRIEEKPKITAIEAQPEPRPAPIAVFAPAPLPTLKPLLAKTKPEAPQEIKEEIRIAINIWDYVQ